MKRMLALMLAAMLMLSMTACGGSTVNTPPVADGSEAVVESGDVSENPEISEPVEETVAPETTDLTPTPPIGSSATPLAVGETVTNEKCEFFVDYAKITSDVIPPSPGSWYSHYEAEQGKVYVDICVSYKNLDSRDIGAENVMSATLVYSGKYQYTGFSIIEEDNRNDFTYTNITSISPLSTEYVHYLFEVPEEIEDTDKMLLALVKIDGTEYRVTVRDGSEVDDYSISEDATEKTSGEVSAKEVIAIPSVCEFYIDYSNITNDVVPPTPGDWYSHYEADNGKVYVDVCFAYKNLEDKDVGADSVIAAKLTYSGKYEYSGFSMIEEDSRGDFTYSNITSISPLATEYVHYLFEVPEEVASSADPVAVTFTIEGNTYNYNVR